MKTFISLITVLLICPWLAFSQESDPWNALIWNRSNVESGSNDVDRGPWFEWWYYKVVIPETQQAFFFVYGVVNPWDHAREMAGSRAILAAGDFTLKRQAHEALPVTQFHAAYDRTRVQVGPHSATDQELSGSLNENGFEISWSFRIEKTWSYKPLGYLMGGGVTNIDWYPAQAGATCTGTITSGGKAINFENAPCYQDRNWGRSFPDWWTWIVANHFEGHRETVLAIGGGKPQVLGVHTPYSNVTVGLKHKGAEYTFRPHYLDFIRARIEFGVWEVQAENTTHRLEISAWAPPKDFMDLEFTTPQGEVFHDFEALRGQVSVRILRRTLVGWALEDEIHSEQAGIEFGSKDLKKLQSLENQIVEF